MQLYADVDTHFLTRFTWNVDTVKRVIALYKERVKTLKCLVEEVLLVHNGPPEHNAEDMQKWITADTTQHLDAIIDSIWKNKIYLRMIIVLQLQKN